MTKELVISSNRHETKVALLEDDQLVEIFFQRSNEYSLVGSIHKGRVTRVLPGMQSAFVELGLERDAFLYVSDFLEQTGEDYERITAGGVADDSPRAPEPRASTGAAEPRSGGESSRGGGGRRDRDRGGRDRGGRPDREPRPAMLPPRPAMLPVAAAVAPPPTAAVPMDMPADAAEAGASLPLDGGAERPQGEQDRDPDGRRGRGRRRRRRSGRGPGGAGMPESKFASPNDAGTDETDDEQPLEASPVAEEVRPPAFESRSIYAAPPRPSEEEVEQLVLPGESIAKYRPPSGPPRDAMMARPVLRVEQPVAPPPPPPPVIVEAVQAEAEPEVEVEDEEVRDLVAEHIEAHQRAFEAEAATPVEIEDEEDDEEEVEADAEAGGEAEDEVDALQAAAEAALASGEPLDSIAPPSSGQAGVREEQSTARFVQRRDRGRRRGGRNGGGSGGGSGGGGGSRSGGGERYDSVPRTEAQPAAASVEARDGGAPALEPAARPDRGRDRERPVMPSISDLLKEGQEIIVQIYKEPLGTKGARITSHIAMPGRFVVFMPTADHHGVSRKLGDDEERHRLKLIVQSNSQGMVGGFIVRTAGEGKPEADIAADMSNLYNQWLDIRKKAEKRRAPCLLHSDLELVTRTLRDQVNDQYKAIWTDNEEMYEMIVGFLELFQPALVSRVKMYSREAPIFDTFNITSELEKALRPKVWLKSGGYIVINQTEALVAIDINTGKFVGKSNRLEDTIVKTNVEAVKELVRQIRLRDLGGIIVVDFIDMEERKNRQKVMQALEEAMGMDRAPYKILQFNDFGLVAITRRRVKQSLERALCSPCPTCEGAGYVKSVQTVMSEILTEAHKIRPGLEGKDVMLRVNPEVAKEIKSVAETYLQELEDILGRVVIVKSDPLLHPDKFDLA